MKTFPADFDKAIGDLRPHDHLALIFDSKSDWLTAFTPILEQQLAEGKGCIYISGSQQDDDIVLEFADHGLDVKEALQSGQFTIVDPPPMDEKEHHEAVIRHCIKTLEPLLKSQASKFRSKIFLAEDMQWLKSLDLDGFLAYEAALDQLINKFRGFRLCQYDRQVFPAELILEILKIHKLVIYQKDIYTNPFFVPPNEVDPKRQAQKEVERMLTGLKDLKQWENELISTIKNLNYLVEINKAISGSMDLDEVVNETLNNIMSHLDPAAASVLLLDPVTKDLRYYSVRGFLRRYSEEEVQIEINRAFWQDLLFHYQTPVVHQKAGRFNNLPQSVKKFEQERFDTYYAAPLVSKGEVRGVLEIYLAEREDGPETWRPFIEALVNQLANAIGNAQAYDDLQQKTFELTMAYDTTIARFARAMDQRDNRIRRNTQRVAEMTERLARAMGATEEEIVNIRRGVLLEDISKLSLLDKIMQKQGPLTDKEWKIVHQHPQVVYNLLEDISVLRPALEIPYCHHENWDGSGYPRGIAGEQIPLSARQFAVVNVYDALLTDRPYRPSWEEVDALAYIQSLSGSQFDPEVVDAFFKMLDKNM
jgi:HD-GYP domain-containing protein (c-di-GMP phosphodiesterase class II)